MNSAMYSNAPAYAFQQAGGHKINKEVPQEQLITEYQTGYNNKKETGSNAPEMKYIPTFCLVLINSSN